MCQYAVYLDNVSFGYGEKVVFEGLTLQVKHGEHIGILGESGCGKSTLLKLLAGLYEPDAGQILIDGESTPEKIRGQIAMVMQHNSLFPLSIRENITCGHTVPEEKLWAVCQSAGLVPWIESLPQGLDTNVGERGSRVSGGQAQRIQIARALGKEASIVLLDEPTSALDRENRKEILKTLQEQLKDKTVIHVTHHPENLDGSYKIYRLMGGRLVHE